jgi:hypothetical protein
MRSIINIICGFFVALLAATVVEKSIAMFELPIDLTWKQILGALLLISSLINSARFSSDMALQKISNDEVDNDTFSFAEKWLTPLFVAIYWLFNWGMFYIISKIV